MDSGTFDVTDLTISINGLPIALSGSYSGNANIWNFELPQTIFSADILRISYTPGTMADTDGDLLEAVSLRTVANYVQGASETIDITGAVVQDASPNTIRISLSEPLLTATIDLDDLTILVNSVERTISGAVNGIYLDVTIYNEVNYGDTVTVTYAGNTWATADGKLLDMVANYPVTNNVVHMTLEGDDYIITGDGFDISD